MKPRKSGDVNDQGQDNTPVGVCSKLGCANMEMGALVLDIRCKCWIANHSSMLLNQGQLDVSAQGQDNPFRWGVEQAWMAQQREDGSNWSWHPWGPDRKSVG